MRLWPPGGGVTVACHTPKPSPLSGTMSESTTPSRHSGAGRNPGAGNGPLLAVEGLAKLFSTRRGTLKAVDGVSFTLEERRTLGLVGESGCGSPPRHG